MHIDPNSDNSNFVQVTLSISLWTFGYVLNFIDIEVSTINGIIREILQNTSFVAAITVAFFNLRRIAKQENWWLYKKLTKKK